MASLSTGRTGINQANLSSLSIHRTLHALAESCMLACTVKMLALLKQKDEILRGNAGASATIVKVSKMYIYIYFFYIFDLECSITYYKSILHI